MRWPGKVPRGKTVAQVGITLDLTATILAATNTARPDGLQLDGVDLVPLVRDGAAVQDRTLFWRTLTPARQQRAVRHGKWKLVLDGGAAFLFDLSTDPGERQDLAMTRPDVVSILASAIRTGRKTWRLKRRRRGRPAPSADLRA